MASTDKGYVKIYRNVTDNWLWSDKPFAQGQAWIDLIMMASHCDRTIPFDGAPFDIAEGEIITSIVKLADRWGWSRSKTSRFLNSLERAGMIRQNRTPKRTTVFLVNYSNFQEQRAGKRATGEQVTSNWRATGEHIQDIIGITEDIKDIEEPSAYDPLAGVRKRYDDL